MFRIASKFNPCKNIGKIATGRFSTASELNVYQLALLNKFLSKGVPETHARKFLDLPYEFEQRKSLSAREKDRKKQKIDILHPSFRFHESICDFNNQTYVLQANYTGLHGNKSDTFISVDVYNKEKPTEFHITLEYILDDISVERHLNDINEIGREKIIITKIHHNNDPRIYLPKGLINVPFEKIVESPDIHFTEKEVEDMRRNLAMKAAQGGDYTESEKDEVGGSLEVENEGGEEEWKEPEGIDEFEVEDETIEVSTHPVPDEPDTVEESIPLAPAEEITRFISFLEVELRQHFPFKFCVIV